MDHECHCSIAFRFYFLCEKKTVILYSAITDTLEIRMRFMWDFCFCAIDSTRGAHKFSVSCKQWLRTWWNLTYRINTNHFKTFLSVLFQYAWLHFIKSCSFGPHKKLFEKNWENVFEAVFVNAFSLTPVGNFLSYPINRNLITLFALLCCLVAKAGKLVHGKR